MSIHNVMSQRPACFLVSALSDWLLPSVLINVLQNGFEFFKYMMSVPEVLQEVTLLNILC